VKASFPHQPSPAARGRLHGIDGLRAVAAVSVLVFHVWKYSSPAGPVDLGYVSRFALPHLAVGVTLFFTLSGYLLYRPVVTSLLATGNLPSARRYFRNRALRILPAYWVILGVIAILLPAALVRDGSSNVVLGRLVGHPGQLLANVGFSQNYVPSSVDTGIAPAWSLAIEVVFYLALPGLALLAFVWYRRAATIRRQCLALLIPAIVLLVLGSLGRAATVWLLPPGDHPGHDIVARSFLANGDLFAPGMALAVLHVFLQRGQWRLPRYWRQVAWAALVGDVLCTVVLSDKEIIWRWGLLNPYQRLTSLACLLLLALVVLPHNSHDKAAVLVRLLESRPLVLTGLASYSLFLWHEPMIRLMTSEGLTASGRPGFFLNVAIFALVGGVLSALTYRYVERPSLARKSARVQEILPAMPAHIGDATSPETAARTPSV
jgi:peptidoglycan/LPS O-acetylase OafA/YrhL